MLKIYNSLTRQKEKFTPIKEKQVGIYVCGMTVYDYCHIGHARVAVSFDMIARYLRAQGYAVNYVRNITDIDDKIIQRALEQDEAVEELTARFIQAMHEDLQKLNVLPVDQEPCATAHIAEIIRMIETLIEKSYAYQAVNGDVYYAVKQFANYGKLSHRDLSGELAGARVEIGLDKKDPLDFVLWKAAKPGEPSWESPWGPGRPGWHIECSAMSTHCLGNHFDIHGGGFDLMFPHHENEVAQSEAATGETFVNTWMHVGFVQINHEKMSKSLGNFFTIREVLEKYHPEVVRYFLLSSHYRSQVNYSDENLTLAKKSLESLYTALREFSPSKQTDSLAENLFTQRFNQAMDDDFNTPEAIAVLFDLAHEINRVKTQDKTNAEQLAQQLYQLGEILGILQTTPQAFLQFAVDDLSQLSNAQIESLIAERNQAREQKNWALADKLRDELLANNIILEDSGRETTWRRQ
jgi:cysteinyl-tRNA synthetase